MLVSWTVLSQGLGFSLGPFLGGLLHKAVGFGEHESNDIFNGFTSPGWIMVGVWLIFWVIAAMLFEDVEPSVSRPVITSSDTLVIELQPVGSSAQSDIGELEPHRTTRGQ